MRKLWLTFTAMLLCSISTFAQLPTATQPSGSGSLASPYLITKASEFVWIAEHDANNKYYEQTDNIDLGDLGTLDRSIIPTFTGIYDGKGYTITYQANFSSDATLASNNYSLFGSVGYDLYIFIYDEHKPGTIKNLNVNANVTLSGRQNNMNVALLCGQLGSLGVIENCNVSGNVNSTVNPSLGGGSDAGLLVGESAGTVKYCTGSGNVVGVGYAGGLIGQMKKGSNASQTPSLIACSFTGAVTAVSPRDVDVADGYGSFAGGICGHSDNNSTIQFAVSNATITSGWVSSGIVSVNTSGGTTLVKYTYADGEIIVTETVTENNTPVNSNTTNSTNSNNTGHYYGDDPSYQEALAIVNALETARTNEDHTGFYFDVVNGDVVLIIGTKPNPSQTPNYTHYRTIKDGGFNEHTTWQPSLDGITWEENKNIAPQPKEGITVKIIISEGHRVTVSHNLKITGAYYIEDNNGVLQILQEGQLINTTDDNVPGIVEIVSPQKNNGKWTFIGAPFENKYGNENNGYKLETIYPMSHDISVSKYEYGATPGWSDSWATVGTKMEAGEGYFAWPFYDGAVIFTTYGDVWNYTEGKVGNYVFNGQTKTNLNNTDVTFTKTITESEDGGRWMALANPYPAKLDIEEFVKGNKDGENHTIQGQGIYRLTNNTVTVTETVNGEVVEKEVQTYQFVTSGDITMTEGFFVNLAEGYSSVTFRKNQLTANKQQPTDNPPTTQQKSQVAPREFVELSLVKGKLNSKLYFAHNQEAEQNYDIFDANKLFAIGEVAEPYFVTDGNALVKEEVKELPYYATMNVRSFANDTVSFVVNNIPEGLAVSIIDGENIIDMVEGGVYTTEILTGENADRFKVLIKKSLSISDVEELEVNITNNNRHISIETTETDLQVEVYNALGQKVLSTKDRNFTLNQVSAGAYLIKAFNNKASKTQKIVVE